MESPGQRRVLAGRSHTQGHAHTQWLRAVLSARLGLLKPGVSSRCAVRVTLEPLEDSSFGSSQEQDSWALARLLGTCGLDANVSSPQLSARQ